MKVLIYVQEPGDRRWRQVGKFVTLTNGNIKKTVYVYSPKEEDLDMMRDLGAYGVAPCVLQAMEDHGVEEIHFCPKDKTAAYVTTPEIVRKRGIVERFGKRKAAYYHLPFALWQARPRPNYPWATQKLQLDWMSPDEMELGGRIEQVGLFAEEGAVL